MSTVTKKRGVSGSMELLYSWEEVQSGFQPKFITTVSLKSTNENYVTMRYEFQVNDYSPSGHGGKDICEYDISVDDLIELVKVHGKKRIIL
jgi:hypothetical protein